MMITFSARACQPERASPMREARSDWHGNGNEAKPSLSSGKALDKIIVSGRGDALSAYGKVMPYF